MFQATEKQHDVGITIMRVVAGLVFVMHGWQKFSTMGHSGVTGFFGQAHIPFASVSAWIVMLLELVGGVLLAIGFLTRVIAAAFAFEMLVAIAAVHFKHGFFMPMGYEFAFTLLAVSLGLAVAGAGAPSVDALIARRSS